MSDGEIMRSLRKDERQLRMMWKVEKNGRTSFLVGTAHFFPFSFRTSFTRLFQEADTVIFEGPLDEQSMQKVVKAGFQGSEDRLLAELDEQTLEKISNALRPSGWSVKLMMALQFGTPLPQNVEVLIKGMRPWMAFFTIYTTYAKQQGWNRSVDMEAYRIAGEMGKEIAFLETIEEQIEVLDSLSLAQIVDFLRRVEHWKTYMSYFVQWYLAGDLEKMGWNPYGFPTRNPLVIERRDKIMYTRMLPYLERGAAAVCLGSPHIVGISRLLQADGYQVGDSDGCN